MLSRFHIKEHAKGSVYTHLFSCFGVVALASALPVIASYFASYQIFQNTNFLSTSFDFVRFEKDMGIYMLIYLAVIILNMPFQYCMMRYFFALSGTAMDTPCPVKVFISGFENIGTLLKGTLAVTLIQLLSAVGIFVGYYPVFLAFCMAPYYIMLDSKITVWQALKKSRELMRGHKMEAFRILLEFILIRLAATLFSNVGLVIFALIMEMMSLAMLYTAIAIIFVRLDMAKKTAESTPSH